MVSKEDKEAHRFGKKLGNQKANKDANDENYRGRYAPDIGKEGRLSLLRQHRG